MLCVRPGVFDVRASPLRCSREFISDDFPTFERPRKAISGRRSAGQSCFLKALFTNSAEVIFTAEPRDRRTLLNICRDLGRSRVRTPYMRRCDVLGVSNIIQSEFEDLVDG